MQRRSRLRPLRVALPLLTVGLAPFLMGAVHPPVYCALIACLLVAFFAEKKVRRQIIAPRAAYAMAALLIFLALSLLPLPRALLLALSPTAEEIRSFTAAGIGATAPGAAAPLSLSPWATWLGMLHHVGALLAFLIGASVFGEYQRHSTAATVVGAAGGVLTLLVALHWLLQLPEVYGFYPSKGSPVAPFINPNHLAAFATFSGIVALGAAWQAKGAQRLALGAASLASLLLVFTTQSRGGKAAALAGLLALFALWLWDQKRGRLWVSALGAALLVGLLLAWSARDALGLSALSRDIKVQVWKDTLPLLGDFPWFGVGRGAFGDVFPQYQSFQEIFYVRSAEMLPLSILAETGLLGLALAVTVGVLFYKTARAQRNDPVERAILAGLVALVLHDFADFSLDVAGVAFPAALLAGALCGRAERRRRASHRAFSWFVLGAAVLSLAGAPWAMYHNAERALRTIQEAPATLEGIRAAARQEIARRPSDGYLPLATAARLIELGQLRAALPFLNRARFLLPQDPRPHILSARAFKMLGRLSQARLEYRAAFEYRPPLEGRVHTEWYDEALLAAPTAEDVAELVPRLRQNRYLLINALTRKERHREALNILWGLVVEDPSRAEDWNRLGDMALKSKAWEEAEVAIRRLEKLEDERAARLLDRLRGALRREKPPYPPEVERLKEALERP